MKSHSFVALAACLMAAQSGADSYYIEPPLFSTAPDPEKSEQTIGRFGPVGMAIDLIQPAFTMRVRSIEDGSPAAVSGFKPGQIIHAINGQVLKGIDPRIQLGQILERAEASDGILMFSVHATRRVVAPCADCPGVANDPNAANRPPPAPRLIEIPVAFPALGAYSPTWPLDCPKSEMIVRSHAEYLKAEGAHKGIGDIGMLFLLSTGDEGDLAYVRDRVRTKKNFAAIPLDIGYGGIALCEYYLRTGDGDVLPVIREMVSQIIEMATIGSRAERGPLAPATDGGGDHLHAGGALVVATLMLAKECGVEIPDEPFQRILADFYRRAGRGNHPYGNQKSGSDHIDNGTNGGLAFAMSAAAALTPEGEKSIYARARDTAAMCGFYSSSSMPDGDIGGEIWRSAAMGLLYETHPHHYREFMDQRKWHYDLSRRHDGSFGMLGGMRHDNVESGTGYALTYTVPRKTLRLTGAPPTPFSKPYQLPERPWGTAADDDFVSAQPPATRYDFSAETLARDAAMPMRQRLGDGNADAETMDRFLHHPDFMVRSTAARSLQNHGPDVAMRYLASRDARVRRAALDGIRHGNGHEKLLTRETFARIIAMLEDPEESWFVKDAALLVAALAPADWIAPHSELLGSFPGRPGSRLPSSDRPVLPPGAADER